MKTLNTLVAIVLSAAGLGSAVTLGVVGNNEHLEKANAAIAESTLYIDFSGAFWNTTAPNIKAQLWGGTGGDQYFYDGRSEWSTISYNGKTYVCINIANYTDSTGMQVYAWNYDKQGHISETINASSLTAGINLITVGSSGSWDVKQPVTLGTLTFGSTVDVIKYGVFDGVLDSTSIGKDTISKDSTYAVPDSIVKSGYHFEGWFTDANCQTKYTDSTVSANMNLYGKYTSLTVDSYVYYITGVSSNPIFTHVYFFGEYNNNDNQWPGTALSSYASEIHGVFSFENNLQLIYKIPVPSVAEFSFILNDGSNNAQTHDVKGTPGAGYWFWLKDGESKYSWSVNADAGAAIDLIVDVEAKRNAVSASGNILSYSICGISSSDAATLYNRYLALSANAKGFVDRSTTYTYSGAYDGTIVPSEENVYYYDIMVQLRAIAVKGNQTVNDAKLIVEINAGNSTLVVVTIASIISLSLVSAFFLLRKKRKEQ